jgi:aspartate aminotransferase
MPDRGPLREALTALQMAMGWIYPNALLQYALPRLEQFSIDVGQLQRKRDLMVEALTAAGYRVSRPDGAFYLFVRTPADDDEQFTAALADQDVFVLPGTLFETPGYFRISLTASEDMIQRALPVFAAAIQQRK